MQLYDITVFRPTVYFGRENVVWVWDELQVAVSLTGEVYEHSGDGDWTRDEVIEAIRGWVAVPDKWEPPNR